MNLVKIRKELRTIIKILHACMFFVVKIELWIIRQASVVVVEKSLIEKEKKKCDFYLLIIRKLMIILF